MKISSVGGALYVVVRDNQDCDISRGILSWLVYLSWTPPLYLGGLNGWVRMFWG